MLYNQDQLMSLTNEELNNFRGLYFHITFTNKKIINPDNTAVTEGDFIIIDTVTSGHFSKPAGMISGFTIREFNSIETDTVYFGSIVKMVTI